MISVVDDQKEESSTPAKKGLFSRWGSANTNQKAPKTPGTPPNSPEVSAKTPTYTETTATDKGMKKNE